MSLSALTWSVASKPISSGAMIVFTFSTALITPLPKKRFFALKPLRKFLSANAPSRNSSASETPVDAPDGTAARPSEPSASSTSTSTVGLPRESMICLALISTIVVIFLPLQKNGFQV